MWRTLFTLSFRLIQKNRLSFFINLFGLAIGLASVLMLLAYVKDQRSFDQWVEGSDHVIRVGYFSPRTSGAPFESNSAPGIMAPTINSQFPHIGLAARTITSAERYKIGERYSDTRTTLADEHFFEIFKPKVVDGDPAKAIMDPNNLIIAASYAEDYFGKSTNIIGMPIEQADGKSMKIGAVIADWPLNSHQRFTHFRRFQESEFADSTWLYNNWTAVAMPTYVRLNDGVSIKDFTDTLNSHMWAHIPEENTAGKHKLVPVKLAKIQVQGREGLMLGLMLVAGFIIAIAVLNFTNLTLSRLAIREKEVAIRRVLGASPASIIAQFLMESTGVTALALLIGLSLAEISMPSFNALMGTDITFSLITDPIMLILALVLLVFVGLSAGLLPAFIMGRAAPSDSLSKGHERGGAKGAKIGQALVIVQFSLAIGLMAATWVVYSQTLFALNRDTGFDADNRIGLYTPRDDHARMRERLERIDGVITTASSFALPGRGGEVSATLFNDNGERFEQMLHFAATPGFFETYGVKPVAGRLRDKTRATDWLQLDSDIPENGKRRPVATIINEQARIALGFKTPEEALGKSVQTDLTGDRETLTIVGVVPNIMLRSVRHETRALVFMDLPPLNQFVTVHYKGNSPDAMMREIEAAWNEMIPTETLRAQHIDATLEAYYADDRRQSILFATFSGLAVLIACLGLYGLSGFNAERRTKEIGIRKVLGARIMDIVQLFVWQFSKPVMFANLIAWPLAWYYLSDWLNQFVHRIDLTPYPFIAAGTAAILIAAITVTSQALRVARQNPVHALKYE